MTITILALGKLPAEQMAKLEDQYNVVKLWQETDPEAALQAHRGQIEAIVSVASKMQVSRRMMESLPNLKIIANFGVGVDIIDMNAARELGIAVTNTPDLVTNDTADIAMTLILNVLRRAVEADIFVRMGKWSGQGFPLATSLTGKKIGILGLGRIGQAIARRCTVFEMEVSYHSRSEKPVQAYKYYPDLVGLAAASDILVLACPGGDETRHLVDTTVLNALGPKGFLINIARGSVVKTDDLLVALCNKSIAGAGLDVYDHEPQVPEALISMDNVVLLPHIGTATVETRAAMGKLVLQNLAAQFEGRPLITPIG